MRRRKRRSLLNGIGIPTELHQAQMSALDGRQKVKVLLAQALFGHPSIILLDEPTNGLDVESTEWLEDFLVDCSAIVIVVSHDRHFLNAVCTNIVDVDHETCKMYAGNYDFWYDSSQLFAAADAPAEQEAGGKDPRPAGIYPPVCRQQVQEPSGHQPQKGADSMQIEQMPASSRKYPFVGFEPEREKPARTS